MAKDGPVILAKLQRADFEQALKDQEHHKMERLTDFILELPAF